LNLALTISSLGVASEFFSTRWYHLGYSYKQARLL
jgi:hypothetical protein